MQPDEASGIEQSRFDVWRARLGFVFAPLVFLAVWWAPLGLPLPAHRLAAILAAVGVLWVSEAIPMAMTAFVGVSVAVVVGVAPASEAFAPFADPLVFLFVGSFILARSIFVHGLDRRLALGILSWRIASKSPWSLLMAYSGTAALLSMWISNTATVAMMYPIGLSILAALEQQEGGRPRAVRRFGAGLLLSCAFGASIGGLATPVGTPPNLIGLGFLRRSGAAEIPFFSWMLVAMPVVFVLWFWMVFRFRHLGRGLEPALMALRSELVERRQALGSWSAGERNTVLAFLVTVSLWIAPGVVALFCGREHPAYIWLISTFPEGVAALLGASLLFVLPIDARRNRFTLTWEEAARIDWWIVFLYGGGLALGNLAFHTGLAEAAGRALTQALGIERPLGLLFTATVAATALSETTSNTSAANMVVPVAIAFARAAGTDPVLPALGATMAASLGFLLPVSTPTNAIVYSSGRVPLTFMIRYGALLDLAGILVVTCGVAVLGLWVLAHR
ncbi:MAG: DASS family sodium-coupled anion symporter [Candidatus Binatia bacterium]|nr:DASS family sodium-coupled anion symporter [Candidatus Binatia bacterium]